MDAIDPASPLNPYRTQFHKDRNYLMWLLYRDTGARRDEIRNVKPEDIDFAHCCVHIRVSKTIPRTVYIKKSTSKIFHDYILGTYRELRKHNKRVTHLFTTRGGKQLAKNTINQIFTRFRNKVAGIPDWLGPHTLRYTWNDNLSVSIDSTPGTRDHEHERQQRNRLMGWSEKSKMADRYTRRHVRRSADEIAEKLSFPPSKTAK